MERPGGQATQRARDDPTGSETLVLGDEPAAPRLARRWASDRLRSAGLDQLRDDVELVVGELVANALFHVGPPVEVLVRVEASLARIEVHDRSPASPVPARGAASMTGRGLQLVEAVSRAWGVDARPPGKSIWAELQIGPSVGERDGGHGAASPPALGETPERPVAAEDDPEQRVTVRLGEVPVDLLMAAKAHVDDLVREFALADSGARSGVTAHVPRHLAELLEAVVQRFAEPRRMIKRQALAAAEAGRDHVTLELALPPAAADAGEAYLHALDEVDAYCRAARLLTLETAPRQRVFRRWYVEQLVGQLRQAAEGDALEAAQSFEDRLLDEIDTVAEAERTAERAARLNALAAALAGAVTPEEVADRALHEAVAAMGASGGGLLLSTGRPTLEVAGTLGYDEAVVVRLRSEAPDAALPAAYAARSGQPVWLESRQERDRRFPELVGLEPGTVSMCAVPLLAGGRPLGAMRFSFAQARLFDREERTFALNMAALTAQALDRALLHHRQAETARRLRRHFMPAGLPAIPGVELASAYVPAVAGEISGDFFDVIGGDTGWTLVVGDISGKGVDAAALTAMARHTVRSGALSGLGPGAILGLLNAAFLADHSAVGPGTAVCARLSPHDGQADLTLASAGHPEPLVVRAGGAVEPVVCAGAPVGASPGARYAAVTVTLRPGDLVLFYTDGITRARGGGEPFGRRRLEEHTVAGAGEGAAALVRRVRGAVESFQTAQRDDMAMLALRLPSPRPSRERVAAGSGGPRIRPAG